MERLGPVWLAGVNASEPSRALPTVAIKTDETVGFPRFEVVPFTVLTPTDANGLTGVTEASLACRVELDRTIIGDNAKG